MLVMMEIDRTGMVVRLFVWFKVGMCVRTGVAVYLQLAFTKGFLFL